jgi:hypothetical protein
MFWAFVLPLVAEPIVFVVALKVEMNKGKEKDTVSKVERRNKYEKCENGNKLFARARKAE